MSTVKKYKQATDLEHMRNQTGMYLGGKAVIDTTEFVGENDKIIKRKVKISPAALKCFDEILVNAIDQYTLHQSDIYVDYDDDNTISIMNTKSCIDVYEDTTADGRKMMSPQMILGEFRSSSNFDLSGDSTTGGVYGTGAKGTNAFSELFELENYDVKTQKLYYQSWQKCMSVVNPPQITTEEGKESYVRITFKLNFDDFGTIKHHLQDFKKMVYTRVLQTAMFCNRGKVYYNNTLINFTDESFINKYYANAKFTKFSMSNMKGLKWHVAVAIKDNQETLEQHSLVNGIYVKSGTHLEFLTDQIVEYIKPLWIELKDPSKKASKLINLGKNLEQIAEEKARAKAEKQTAKVKELTALEKDIKANLANVPKFDKRYIEKYLFINLICYINRPSFTGQRKDQIDSPQSLFTDYKIPTARLSDIWSNLKPWIEYDIFSKNLSDSLNSGKKRLDVKMYSPAEWAGTKNKHLAPLFVCEGTSAWGTVDKGISNRSSDYNHKSAGIYSIQGVTINVRKEIDIKTNPKTDEKVIIRTEKLTKNERLAGLVQILNLDYGKKYTLMHERDTLTYGSVILACDQDEDGKGNIRSLLLNFFWTFWPELVKMGFVKFLITPIIRCMHPKFKVQEFFNEQDYHIWAAANGGSDGWEVVYYKGLGSHGDAEIKNMFSKTKQLIVTYTADTKTENAFEVYFGDDADLRKIVLKKPPLKSEDQYYKLNPEGCKMICATNHLNTETKSYQIYNVKRHIKHVIDGAMPARRKIWAGSRKRLGRSNERIKVYQLGGDIAKSMNYHHGDASLYGGIIGESQCYPGAREFPMLLPLSQNGSRKQGGNDAASPRYAYTKLNKHLSDCLFPPTDDYLLEYTFDDGKRGEPVYYIPTVPLAILENYASPGHGWTCVTWARDYWEVSDRIRVKLNDPEAKFTKDFSFTKRFNHKIEKINNIENSIAKYEINGDTLKITALPVRVWNTHLLHGNPDRKDSKGIADLDEVVGVPFDQSTDDDIDITINFRKGFLQNLVTNAEPNGIDPIIKYFDLKQSLKPQLNFIGLNKSVEEFQRYDEIFDIWFDIRKDLYQRRIERQTVLVKLEILRFKQQLLYISRREELNLSNKRKVEQNEILEREKFIKIYQGLLDRPLYLETSKLENEILNSKNSNYDYLRKMDADDLSDEGKESLCAKLQKSEDEYAVLCEPNAAKKIQLLELQALDACVLQGQQKGWLSWEVKQNF